MKIVVNGVKLSDESRLAYVANPKQEGSKAHARYEAYQGCTTVGEYFAANSDVRVAKADLRWDHARGFVKFDV